MTNRVKRAVMLDGAERRERERDPRFVGIAVPGVVREVRVDVRSSDGRRSA